MKKLLQRYLFFILGLSINSFGIAFVTKSAMGTSQISSIPYVLSLQFDNLSFGMTTFLMNMVYIILQILILKKDFSPIQFLQIPVNLVFSSFIDLGMWALSWFSPETLITRIISLFIGCIILALGISIEVAPDVIMVPGEGIVKAISQAKHADFGKIKVIFDVTLIIIASLLSFIFFHKLNGVGIGTVISALTVGKFVSIINHHVTLIHKIHRLSTAK